MRRDSLHIFEAAVKAVDAGDAISRNLRRRGKDLEVEDLRLDLADVETVRMIAFGKASLPMAQALLQILEVDEGLVVTHEAGTGDVPGMDIVIGGHPHPTEGSLEAGGKALAMARRCGPSDLLVVLISGGGSALLEDTEIPMQDLRRVSALTLASGMDIVSQNIVRKHLSNVKGGHLADAASKTGGNVAALIVSDIVGDPVSFIASGPTAPDETTFGDAREVLERFALWEVVPASVKTRIDAGIRGEVPETPKPGVASFRQVHNFIVATNRMACEAAIQEAERRGYHSIILTTGMSGEARDAGTHFARYALSPEEWPEDWPPAGKEGEPPQRPAAIVAGGETTVTVRGKGIGGRNQEFVLAAASLLRDRRAVLLSAGTDGRDGETDAAGAVVDGTTWDRARSLGMDPSRYLDHNDSHTFFQRLGDTILTGPTGTNVMDIQILLVR